MYSTVWLVGIDGSFGLGRVRRGRGKTSVAMMMTAKGVDGQEGVENTRQREREERCTLEGVVALPDLTRD